MLGMQVAEAIAQAFEGGGSIGGNSLRAGCSMQLGDELVSVSKTWTLQLQADGDLVLRGGSGQISWSSRTAGRGARLDMLWNGNFVVVDKTESIVFQTGTSAHAAAYAILHDSGLLALYWRGTLLWSSSS
jgi:hypothetical protein